MTLKIRNVNRDMTRKSNRFCGPAAMSVITGEDVDDCGRVMRGIAGQARAAAGFHTWVLKRALQNCGFDLVRLALAVPKPNLRAWFKQSRPAENLYLIVAGNHFAVTQGRRYVCSQTVTVRSTRNAPHLRAIVTEVYMVIQTKPQIALAPAPARPKDTDRKDREAAKKLARRYGVEIDMGDPGADNIYVTHPRLVSETDDPHYGDHYVYSWSGVLRRVEDYVEALLIIQSAGAVPDTTE